MKKLLLLILLIVPTLSFGQGGAISRAVDTLSKNIVNAQRLRTDPLSKPFNVNLATPIYTNVLKDWNSSTYVAADTNGDIYYITTYVDMNNTFGDPFYTSTRIDDTNSVRKIIYLKYDGTMYTKSTIPSVLRLRLKLIRQ